MHFTELIHSQVYNFLNSNNLIPDNLPLKFYWQREESLDPGSYIVYQTEQFQLDNKLDTGYTNFLNNAKIVYEYSELNLQYYSNSIYKPFLPIITSSYIDQEKEYDILFYGTITDRRKEILDKLKLDYNIYVIQDTTVEEMERLISISKYVLSIGIKNNKYNDCLRVMPALQLGGNILLEESEEKWYMDYLKEHYSNRIKII